MMKTFKQYLVENDYPGGYYNQEGRLIQHFNNKEEKEEFDSDPRNDPNDELIFRSDKRMKVNQLLGKAKSEIGKYATPIATAALQGALGDGLLSQVPIEQIENSYDKIQDELRKANDAISQIQAEYKKTKNLERKKQLKKNHEDAIKRKDEILSAWKRYQDKNYV